MAEAKPEAAADPYYLYGYGLGYGGHLGYRGYYGGYGGYGLGYYGGYGHYYGKREADAAPAADAEAKPAADPYYLYGYVLGHHGYRGYYGGYGLGYYGGLGHYYGKREAEPAADAKADPYLLYGSYGLGYAGHFGYPYAVHGLKSAPCVNAANVPVPCA